MIKNLNITLGALVAFYVWCPAVMFAIFVGVLALHVVIIGGMTLFYLMHS